MDTAKSMRVPKKERALIKGALRRIFARSEVHKEVMQAAAVKHSDPKRPRVLNWVLCAVCKKPEARSYVVVDHLVPVVPADMTWDEVVLSVGFDGAIARIWCDKSNLQAICPSCHETKTKAEKEAKKLAKKTKACQSDTRSIKKKGKKK